MLVLQRKKGERILVGEDTVVTVVEVGHNFVRIGVDAPDGTRVDREEVRRKIAAEGVRRKVAKTA
jgi:carbon storage regulator